MALTFEQDQDGPDGMGYFIDDETGTMRYGYDPELADTVSKGFPLTQDQEGKLEDFRSDNPVDNDPAPIEPNAAQDPTQLPGVVAAKSPITGLPSAQPDSWAAAQSSSVAAPTVPGVPARQLAMPQGTKFSGAPPPPPAAPGNTQLSEAEITPGTPGYRYNEEAEKLRTAEVDKRADELQNRNLDTQVILNDQQLQFEKNKAEDEARLNEEREKGDRYEKELRNVVAKEINPDRIKENRGLFGSILGIIGEGLAYLSTPDSGFGRMQAALDRRVERDIAAQKEQKESRINYLTKVLGSAEQAENHYRASVRNLAANTIESRLKIMGVQNQYKDVIQGMRDQADAYNEKARLDSMGKPGTAKYKYALPKVTGKGGSNAGLSNPVADKITALYPNVDRGKALKMWDEAMGEKVSGAANAPTIAEASNNVKAIDRDLALLDAIADENGGEIPTTGVIRIPKDYIGLAARAGIKDGMEAEQVQQVLNAYINQQARSYGGAITESDRAAALTEAGESSQGKIFFLNRLRDKTNDAVRGTLVRKFPGAGNTAMDIFLSDASSNSGVQDTNPKPVNKRTGGDKTKPSLDLSNVRETKKNWAGFLPGSGDGALTSDDMKDFASKQVQSMQDVEDISKMETPKYEDKQGNPLPNGQGKAAVFGQRVMISAAQRMIRNKIDPQHYGEVVEATIKEIKKPGSVKAVVDKYKGTYKVSE